MRAYIGVIGNSLPKQIDEGSAIKIYITNGGTTPAINTKKFAMLLNNDTDAIHTFNNAMGNRPDNIAGILPAGHCDDCDVQVEDGITTDDSGIPLDGKIIIINVNYRDVFGIVCESQNAYVWQSDGRWSSHAELTHLKHQKKY